MRIKKFSLNPMNILKSFFPPGCPRNIWHLLLLISAFLTTAFIVVGILVMVGTAVYLEGGLAILFCLPILLPIAGLVVLAIFCLRKAAGIVRYWALFLWLGFFLLSTGFTILSTTCLHCAGYPVYYPLLCLLGSILLLVFFCNLGNLDRRILAPLFLLFTPFCGILFLPNSECSTAEVVFMFGFTIFFIIYFVFYSLFAIMAVNSTKLLNLPGFRWLFAGFSFFPLGLLLRVLVISYFENYEDLFTPLMLILLLSSPVLVIIGASIFTVKTDPAQLEERLQKAPPGQRG